MSELSLHYFRLLETLFNPINFYCFVRPVKIITRSDGGAPVCLSVVKK